MMRELSVLCVLCAAAGNLFAAHPPELQAIVDRAHSVPAEFAADVLLRVSGKIADKAWKAEVIEDAFRLAAGAQQKLKRRAIEPGSPDNPAQFQGRAFDEDLDALSLQCRAVRAMLPLNPKKARELFQDIPAPQVPKVSCEEALVYDVSAFYGTMAQVAASAFTPKERKEEEHIKFVAGLVRTLSSPVQVAPAAKALASLNAGGDQLQTLLVAFSGALKEVSGDDRSFSFATSREGGLAAGIEQLVQACQQRGVSAYPLVEAFRGFLARHFSGERCARPDIEVKVVSASEPVSNSGLPEIADFFNDKLRPLFPDALRPLEFADLRAVKMEGEVKQPPLWDSAEVKQLAEKYQQLISSTEDKTGSNWQAQLREYLGALADWQPAQAHSAADYFRQKCYLYSNVANLAPNGPEREEVLRGYLSFLKWNGFQQESRMEWFLPVNSLLYRVFGDPRALARIAEDMKSSGDPVIALYANLEQMLPRPPRLMGLL